MKCEQCGKNKFAKKGYTWRAGKKIQRYQCTGCGKTFTIK